MKATPLLNQRLVIDENAFVQMVVWQVPEKVEGSDHDYKYRLALIMDGECVLRFDNEAGKGDHLHIGEDEKEYPFTSLDQLIADFWAQVDRLIQ